MYTGQKSFPIPVQVMGMKVVPASQYLKIELDSIGLQILWDKNQYISVEGRSDLLNIVSGLCGSPDGNNQNEFMAQNGAVLKTAKTFSDAWKVYDESPSCAMEHNVQIHSVEECGSRRRNEAENFCLQMLSNSKLKECIKVRLEKTKLHVIV